MLEFAELTVAWFQLKTNTADIVDHLNLTAAISPFAKFGLPAGVATINETTAVKLLFNKILAIKVDAAFSRVPLCIERQKLVIETEILRRVRCIAHGPLVTFWFNQRNSCFVEKMTFRSQQHHLDPARQSLKTWICCYY